MPSGRMRSGDFLRAHPNPRVLDVATGSGAILDVLAKADGVDMHRVTAIDISPAAIDGIGMRHPDVTRVVADAASTAQDDGSFDLVVSQFGIEYAGVDAAAETARLLAPGGHLIAVLHMTMGALHQPARKAHAALQKLAASRFRRARPRLLRGGIRRRSRVAIVRPYEAAGKAFNPAIQALDGILGEYGSNVADGMLNYLYTTVETMHKRIQYYDADESLAWLQTAATELEHFRGRLDDMDRASLDPDGVQAMSAALVAGGCSPADPEPLMFGGDPLPYGWVLQAAKAG